MSTVEYGLKCRTGAEAGTQWPDVSGHCVQPRSTSEALPSLAGGPGTTDSGYSPTPSHTLKKIHQHPAMQSSSPPTPSHAVKKSTYIKPFSQEVHKNPAKQPTSQQKPSHAAKKSIHTKLCSEEVYQQPAIHLGSPPTHSHVVRNSTHTNPGSQEVHPHPHQIALDLGAPNN